MSKRITSIQFKNYRGFYGEFPKLLLTLPERPDKGLSALIYGENGSGKSSLYQGLYDFFQSSDAAESIVLQKHEKASEPVDEAFVKIEFTDDDGTQGELVFNGTSSGTFPGFVEDTYKLHTFLSYKELLETYFLKRNEDKDSFAELFFTLLIETILRDRINPFTDNSLHSDWEALQQDPTNTELLEKFNNGLEVMFKGDDTLEIEGINHKLQELLQYFNHNIQVEVIPPTLQVVNAIITGNAIELKVTYFDMVNISHLEILNEARLSALALAIYFSSIIVNPTDTDYQILFLDDIFIGLDTSNRMPLLQILHDQFTHYQILLTTYDRNWFETMRSYFPRHAWKSFEMYVHEVTVGGTTIEVPFIVDPSKTYYEKAKDYFELKDYPACANYLRKELERRLKSILPDEYKFEDTNDFSRKEITKLESLINKLEALFKDCNEPFPDDIMKRLRTYRSLVMNPLSHDNLIVPIYKAEIDNAFDVLNGLGTLPKLSKTLLLPIHAIITYNNPPEFYNAEVELAGDLYVIRKDTSRKFTECKYKLNKWTFDGVEYSTMDRSKNQPFPEERRRQMCEQERSLQEIYDGICKTLPTISPNPNVYEEFQIGSRGSLQDVIDNAR